jgi:hypothetical protein
MAYLETVLPPYGEFESFIISSWWAPWLVAEMRVRRYSIPSKIDPMARCTSMAITGDVSAKILRTVVVLPPHMHVRFRKHSVNFSKGKRSSQELQVKSAVTSAQAQGTSPCTRTPNERKSFSHVLLLPPAAALRRPAPRSLSSSRRSSSGQIGHHVRAITVHARS